MDFIAAYQYEIIGIIFMLVLGPAVGNYACSVVYRLPLGRTPFERHPYCGHCGTDLKPVDLFPILSWLSTKGRCRYCQGDIPGIYTLIEIACAVILIGNFLLFDLDDLFLLTTSYGVFVIILAVIQWQQGWISASIYSYAFLCGALAVTLEDGTIFSWVEPACIMLVLALAWHKLSCWYLRRPFRPFEAPWIWWMVLIASITPLEWYPLLLAPLAVLAFFRLLPLRWRPWALWPVAAVALYQPWLVF